MTDRTLAFDIGGSSVKVAVVEGGAQPRIAAQPFAPIPLRACDIEELVDVVVSTTAAALREVEALDGVAISTTGVVDPGGIVTLSGSITGYDGTSWAETIEEAFPGRLEVVHVANDGDCAAWAEFVAGGGIGVKSHAHFVLGTGLGGGAIVGGELVADPPGGRGNFGHVTVPADEPRGCACGNPYCAEAFGATRGVLWGTSTTIRELSARLLTGDDGARAAFATAGEWLGHAIATVTGILGIHTATVGGGLTLAARTPGENVYIDAARRSANELTGSAVQVLESRLGNDAGLLGAAALVRAREVS